MRVFDAILTERLYMRPLERTDADALFQVMGNDSAMTWDYTVRDLDRIRKDLEGRLKHYRVHGFGVYGVWFEGKLVGQCGLQVLKDTDRTIEGISQLYFSHAIAHRGCDADPCALGILTQEIGYERSELCMSGHCIPLERTAGRNKLVKKGWPNLTV